MRHSGVIGVIAVFVAWLAPATRAQQLGFDDFTWTFQGAPSTSGFVTPDLMQVVGPVGGGFCLEPIAAFTTTAPFTGTVRVHLDWTILDICHFDWPVYLLDGEDTQIAVWGDDLNCFLDGERDVEFEVQAGQSFGLGVGSSDCWEGPGIADWTEFSLLPPDWTDVGGALDPRVELEVLPATKESKTFGSYVASVGDTNGDGHADFAVGLGYEYVLQAAVSLHSGADGSLLWMRGFDGATSDFCAPGDVNGDGIADVGMINYGDSLVMLSGADGSTLWAWTLSEPEYIVQAAFADLDGDGVIDIAVGAEEDAGPLPVRILSGADGIEFATIQPGTGDTVFGRALGAPGDLDGDDVGELMVRAGSATARVRVYSGATLGEVLVLESPGEGGYKWSPRELIGAGDWDGDGTRDMAVGSPSHSPNYDTLDVGSVLIFSGATAEPLLGLYGPYPNSLFGEALAGDLDVDGDALPELAIGVPASPYSYDMHGGSVLVVRAPDGAPLQTIEGVLPDHLGSALAWQAGAREPTLIVGIPHVVTGQGRVRLYADMLHAGGAPGLSAYGGMAPDTPALLQLEHGLPENVALLVIGLLAGEAPFKGGVLVPEPHVVLPVALDRTGGAELTAPGLSVNALPIQVWVQAWMPDPAGPNGWSATRAMRSPDR